MSTTHKDPFSPVYSSPNGRLRKASAPSHQRSRSIEQDLTTDLRVGVDGSTLFSLAVPSTSAALRYADFLKKRVVVETTPAQPDGIATPPVRTLAGVLPLSVRRAAGVMQSLGGLMVGLGVLNLMRIPSTPVDRRGTLLLLLAGLVAYGGIMFVLGLLLVQGRPHSRDLALFGGGAASAAFAVCLLVTLGNNGMALGVLALGILPI